MTPTARFQIGSLLTAYAFAGLFWGVLAAAMPFFQVQANLTDAGFGLALGLMALSAFPVMRTFGRYLHRIEAIAIPLAMGAFAASTLVLVLVPGRPGVLAGFILVGAASGALDIALNNRTARIELDTGARLFNRMYAVFPLAMLTASAATGAFREIGGSPDILFAIIAVMLFASAYAEYLAGRHVAAERQPDAPAPARARLSGPLLILALIAALAAFQEAAAAGWAAIYVENVLGGSALAAGLAPAAYTLGLAAGRMGAHLVERQVSARQTLLVAALVAIPAFAVIAVGPPVSPTILLFFIAGCGIGPLEPAVFRAASHRADAAGRGPALAAVTTIAYLGYLISPPALGLVAGYFGWPALWGTSALFACVIVYLTTRLSRSAS